MNHNIKNTLIKNINAIQEKLIYKKSKNIINYIIEDCYNDESILNKSYDDITSKILDNKSLLSNAFFIFDYFITPVKYICPRH